MVSGMTPAQRAKIEDLRGLLSGGRVTVDVPPAEDGVARLHCASRGRWWLVWLDAAGRLHPFDSRPETPCLPS